MHAFEIAFISFFGQWQLSEKRFIHSKENQVPFRNCSLTWSMTGSEWLKYSQATFQIFSKNAEDGSPVQYGDVVGFKYPYSTNSAWLTNYRGRFYPRNCSCCSKSSCAAENTNTGFKIFKKLPQKVHPDVIFAVPR